MKTKHELIAGAIVAAAQTAEITSVSRDDPLPQDCPEEGIANFVFDGPRKIGDRLGDDVREISRTCQIELVVMGETQAQRIERYEAALIGYGQLLADLDLASIGVDHMEIGEPVEPDVIAMAGASLLRAAVIPIELLYETSNNPMETAP